MSTSTANLSRQGSRSQETSVSENMLDPRPQYNPATYIFSGDGTVSEVSTSSGTYSAELCTTLGGVRQLSETVGKFAAVHYKADFQRDEGRGKRSQRDRRRVSNRKSTNARNRAMTTRLDVLENMFVAMEVQNESLWNHLNQMDAEIRALEG